MITKRNYKNESDLDAVYHFLSKSYDKDLKVDNWDSSRWFFNRFCIHSNEELSDKQAWTKSIQIWEENDQITAVSHCEEPNDYFIQIDKDYVFLLDEVFTATMKRAKELLPKSSVMNISSLESDKARIELFEQWGGIRNDFIDDNRLLMLDDIDTQFDYPRNYSIQNIDTSNNDMCEKVAHLYTKIWPTSPYISNGATVANFHNALAFKEELSFVVLNHKQEYTAFTVLWSDTNNKHAHLYPFGLDRDIAGDAAAEVLLHACIDKLKSLGYKSLTLSAYYSDEDEAIFKKVGFKNTESSVSYAFSL